MLLHTPTESRVTGRTMGRHAGVAQLARAPVLTDQMSALAIDPPPPPDSALRFIVFTVAAPRPRVEPSGGYQLLRGRA
jgi:hypothetical protein